METAAVKPPVWKYQRQFDFAEGVSTLDQRPSLLRDETPKLLSDEQVRAFIANGCLTLQPELPAAFHREMFDRFVGIIGSDNDHNPGNNLLPLVPELQLVFDDPVIKGALKSVLGEDYMMHPPGCFTTTRLAAIPSSGITTATGLQAQGPQSSPLVGDDHVLPARHLRADWPDRHHPRQPVHRPEARGTSSSSAATRGARAASAR